jgi:hypothetical protein
MRYSTILLRYYHNSTFPASFPLESERRLSDGRGASRIDSPAGRRHRCGGVCLDLLGRIAYLAFTEQLWKEMSLKHFPLSSVSPPPRRSPY